MEVRDIVQEAEIKTIPKKKICKKAKGLSEEALQITEKKRRKRQRRKGKKYLSVCRIPKRSKERKKKSSSVINANKQRKTIEWERLEINSRKLEIPREHFMQR